MVLHSPGVAGMGNTVTTAHWLWCWRPLAVPAGLSIEDSSPSRCHWQCHFSATVQLECQLWSPLHWKRQCLGRLRRMLLPVPLAVALFASAAAQPPARARRRRSDGAGTGTHWNTIADDQ
jgi:hypothetical protein